MTSVKFRALKVMEQLRGKPFDEFGYKDFADTKVKGIMFDIYKMHSGDCPTAAGPYTRDDIYGAPTKPAIPPGTTPAAGTQPQVSQERPAGTPTTKAAPRRSEPADCQWPTVSTEPLRTNKPDAVKKPPEVVDVQSDPKIVTYYGERFCEDSTGPGGEGSGCCNEDQGAQAAAAGLHA